uniref:F-box domain-containing protein n=1 Tax=Hucho hucho TaxID=62062 RepID=A0A4W5K041_9TELE
MTPCLPLLSGGGITAMALPAVFGLPVLPPELLLRVLRLLDVSSLLALSSVNRHLNQSTTDPALWRHLYRRDFRDCQDHSRARDTQWREVGRVIVSYVLTMHFKHIYLSSPSLKGFGVSPLYLCHGSSSLESTHR